MHPAGIKKFTPAKKASIRKKHIFCPYGSSRPTLMKKTTRREKLFTTDLFHSRSHPFSLPRRAASRKRVKGHRKKRPTPSFSHYHKKKCRRLRENSRHLRLCMLQALICKNLLPPFNNDTFLQPLYDSYLSPYSALQIVTRFQSGLEKILPTPWPSALMRSAEMP